MIISAIFIQHTFQSFKSKYNEFVALKIKIYKFNKLCVILILYNSLHGLISTYVRHIT